MSCLDCSCILRTRVESIRVEKQLENISSQDLTDELAVCWGQSTQRGDEQIPWSSDVSHYDLQVEIGKGCNNLTSIYLARHIPTGTLVAVRITDLEKCSEELLKALQNEVILSHFFRHPNILTFWAMFTAGRWLWVISPFMAYNSASCLLRTYFPEGMSEALIGNILFGAISGLNYMHQHGYIHRSIKASHILISGDGLVYLSGLNHLYSLVSSGQQLKAVYDFPQFSTSMLPWLSPELLRQDMHGYNVKSDIYSVGITACELANGHVPFQDMPRTQMLLQKLKELCLHQDPEQRPSARGLLSHDFFKQVKEDTKGSLLSLLPPAIKCSQSQIPTVHSAAIWNKSESPGSVKEQEVWLILLKG
ncbi:STE20-related kinase adapter protein beta [Crotalus adamanteus]|uniref:STE20-related kinase adapter protein beta n=1 Tax=Crotalus adamanteus TaxID=8729 RepID=A0AAW1CA29_CROAD